MRRVISAGNTLLICEPHFAISKWLRAIIAGVVIFDQSRAVTANKIILWRKSQSGGSNTLGSRHEDAANSVFPFAYLQLQQTRK
jgi:hypothetical protein